MVCCKFIALWKSCEAEVSIAQHRDAASTAPFLANQGQNPLVTHHCHLCSYLLGADILQVRRPSVILGCIFCIHKGSHSELSDTVVPSPKAEWLQELCVNTASPVSATLNLSGAD